jgi:putative addiction module component (TIGR02574 family)
MSSQLEIIEAEALKLQPADRSLLVEHLLASLDSDEEVEAAWAVEVEKRITDLDNGAVVGISLQDTLTQIRSAI